MNTSSRQQVNFLSIHTDYNAAGEVTKAGTPTRVDNPGPAGCGIGSSETKTTVCDEASYC